MRSTATKRPNVMPSLPPNCCSFLTAEETMLRSEFRSETSYYSVIARAVFRLPNNTIEARQALYDRAAVALASELQQNSQVSEEKAAFERLAFEGAIRKFESDERNKEQARQFEHKIQHPFTSLFRVFRL